MTLQDFQRLLHPYWVRIANMVSLATVQTVDDDNDSQLLQLEMAGGIGEVRDEQQRLQNYGFTSVPLEGALAAVVFVGGKRDSGITVAVDDPRYRPTGLEGGEVCVYTDQGDRVIIKRGGTIEVTASTKVKVDAPVVELAGNSDAALKGSSYQDAEALFLNALTTYLGAIKTIADPTNAATPLLLAAITAFKTATTLALSAKVKLS